MARARKPNKIALVEVSSAVIRTGKRGKAAATSLGQRLRRARKAHNATLRTVSKRAGCSVSLLSKFENDHASPSVRMLHRIAAALETNVGAFFDHHSRSQIHIAKAGERPMLRLEPGGRLKSVALERLLPHDGKRVLQGNIHIVPPGQGSSGSIRHEGEEFGYLLQGRLRLQIGSKRFDLGAGDSFAFPSHLEHSYENPGRVTARIIWINTPPTF